MIPRIIHYCWFGNSCKTELVEKCISFWKDRESVVVRFIRKHPAIDRGIVSFNALLKKIMGPKWQDVTTKIRRALGLPTKK